MIKEAESFTLRAILFLIILKKKWINMQSVNMVKTFSKNLSTKRWIHSFFWKDFRRCQSMGLLGWFGWRWHYYTKRITRVWHWYWRHRHRLIKLPSCQRCSLGYQSLLCWGCWYVLLSIPCLFLENRLIENHIYFCNGYLIYWHEDKCRIYLF